MGCGDIPFKEEAFDDDAAETREWLDALDAVVREKGPTRARFLLTRLAEPVNGWALMRRPALFGLPQLDPLDRQGDYPGDLALGSASPRSFAGTSGMVIAPTGRHGDLGGHIASYASAAEIFEVGSIISFAER